MWWFALINSRAQDFNVLKVIYAAEQGKIMTQSITPAYLSKEPKWNVSEYVAEKSMNQTELYDNLCSSLCSWPWKRSKSFSFALHWNPTHWRLNRSIQDQPCIQSVKSHPPNQYQALAFRAVSTKLQSQLSTWPAWNCSGKVPFWEQPAFKLKSIFYYN